LASSSHNPSIPEDDIINVLSYAFSILYEKYTILLGADASAEIWKALLGSNWRRFTKD
jgi:hypothetical protein